MHRRGGGPFPELPAGRVRESRAVRVRGAGACAGRRPRGQGAPLQATAAPRLAAPRVAEPHAQSALLSDTSRAQGHFKIKL